MFFKKSCHYDGIFCFKGTTAATQVGSDIVDNTSGGPSSVKLDKTTLGVSLDAGDQYSVRAKCLNDESYETDWTTLYPFKTLIFSRIESMEGSAGYILPKMSFTYNKEVLSVSECGVYVSTDKSGAGTVKKVVTEKEALEGWKITGFEENTTYYAVPFVKDNLDREYTGDWTEASSANTGYNAPAVTISNTVTTYNSVSGNFTVSTNDTLSSVYIDVWPTGGQTHYKVIKTATTGIQNFTITNGDKDSDGTEIVINPSTEIRLTVYATNTSGETGSAIATVTTASQSQSTIAITGIQDVTPVSAVVTLSYGSGS